MEADWEAEIGPGLPVIEAAWPGFVDLRAAPDAIASLPEVQACPALAQPLAILNTPASPLFSSKCDAWAMNPGELDPDEYGSIASQCIAGHAAYIDVVREHQPAFQSFEAQERCVRDTVDRLRLLPIANGRVDLVIRAAEHAAISGFAVTLYAAGCGPDRDAAQAALAAVLQAATVTMLEGTAGE